MLAQLEFKVINSTNEDLEDLVKDWLRDTIFFIGGSWYTHKTANKDVRRLDSISECLRLRWLNGNSVVKIAIEQKMSNDSNWLGGYKVGDFDPFLLNCFSRHYEVSNNDIDLVEDIVKKQLPGIEIVKCSFCENRFGNTYNNGAWYCADCDRDFVSQGKKDTAGFVYVFGSVTDGYYKIGRSNKPNSRMRDYENSKLPFPVEMLHRIPVDNEILAEAELHRLFREKHSYGEWYKLSGDDVARIVNLKKYTNGRWLQ